MEAVFLVFFLRVQAGGPALDIETVAQALMEQCEENGAALNELHGEMKWKCIKGIK